jgi:hypothetical protein
MNVSRREIGDGPYEDKIGYALVKHLPEIAHRAQFETDYGELIFEGDTAKRIAVVVERELRKMLRKELSKKER